MLIRLSNKLLNLMTSPKYFWTIFNNVIEQYMSLTSNKKRKNFINFMLQWKRKKKQKTWQISHSEPILIS